MFCCGSPSKLTQWGDLLERGKDPRPHPKEPSISCPALASKSRGTQGLMAAPALSKSSPYSPWSPIIPFAGLTVSKGWRADLSSCRLWVPHVFCLLPSSSYHGENIKQPPESPPQRLCIPAPLPNKEHQACSLKEIISSDLMKTVSWKQSPQEKGGDATVKREKKKNSVHPISVSNMASLCIHFWHLPLVLDLSCKNIFWKANWHLPWPSPTPSPSKI